MKKELIILLVGVLLISTVLPVYGNQDGDFIQANNRLFMARMMIIVPTIAMISASASTSYGFIQQPMYQASDMPDWDIDVFADGGLFDVGHTGIGGWSFEADATNVAVGLCARKDRIKLDGAVHYENLDGKGTNGNGLESDNTGFIFMPGYRVWTQEENGINLDVDAILDLSYRTFTGFNTPDDWFIRPGVRAAANYMTEFGLFQATYAYTYLRNLDHHRDQSGNSSYNAQAYALDYISLITKTIYGDIGISQVNLYNTAAGLDNDFTDLNIRIGTLSSGHQCHQRRRYRRFPYSRYMSLEIERHVYTHNQSGVR
jgi:hypothetical protein